MIKPILSKLLLTTLLIISINSYAQSQPSLHITSSNINAGVTNTTYTFTAGSCLASVIPFIDVIANEPIPLTIPLSKIKVIPTQIGTGINLVGSPVELPLSKSSSRIYTAVLGLLNSSGAVMIRYSINEEDIKSYAWQAGSFPVPLTFSTPGGVLCLGSTSYPVTFTLTVDPVIKLSGISDNILQVNSFDAFRTTGVTKQNTFSIAHTIPLSWSVKTNAILSYSGGYQNAPDPNTSSSLIHAKLLITNPAHNYPAIQLTSTTASLINNEQLAITVGNQTFGSIDYSISAASLRNGFIQKGNYSTPIDFVIKDASLQYPIVSTPISNLTVQVADMGELQVNNREVELNLESVTDYQNGVSIDIPNHLTISKTSAYDIYVFSGSNNLINGTNTIPVSTIQIGPGTGQTGVNTVQLSKTPQKILSGAYPCLDRPVNIQYKIGKAQAQTLFGKTIGTYSTTVTYSFTAP